MAGRESRSSSIGEGLPVEYDLLFVDELRREVHPREIVLRGVHHRVVYPCDVHPREVVPPREVHPRKDLPREVHAREVVPQEAHPREDMEQHEAG